MSFDFSKQKFAVTGSSGMIGREVVSMLVSRGANVRAIDLVDPNLENNKFEFHKADLTSLDSCIKALKDIDYVIACAGIKGSPEACMKYPSKFFVPMVQFNTNSMAAAKSCGVKGYVYISSIGVYHPADSFQENDIWKGFPSENDWFGGWAKRIGELQADAYRIEGDWNSVKVIRPANVYGSFDNFDPKGSMVVPSIIRKVLEATDGIVTALGNGRAIRDFVHARDVARACLFVLENDIDEPINVGSGNGCSIKELVETVISVSGKSMQIEWSDSKSGGDSIRVMDMTRAGKLGFSCQTTLVQGIRETYNWYSDNYKIADNRFDAFK